MSDLPLDVLACPDCRGGLAEASGGLRCAGCGATYAVNDGVPDLVPARLRREMEGGGDPGWSRWNEAIRGLERWRERRRARAREGVLPADGTDERTTRTMFERAGVAGVVVDVGAKDGSKRSLMGPDVRYVGVDPFVKTAPAMPGATLVRGVAEALPVRDGAADAVVSLASFDYYVDGAAAVDEMARVLRPGGCVAMLVSVVSPRVARARGASTRPLRAAYGLLSALDVGPVAAAGLAASAVLEPERPHTHYYTESQVQSFLSRRFDVAWHGETRQRTSTILYLAARKR